MAVPTIYVFNLLTDIAKEQVNADLGLAISEATKGAAKVGGITLVSSLLLGPVGFIVGSVGGGLLAYATSSDFKPLTCVIAEMTDDERERMADVAMDIAKKRGIELALANIVTSSPEARDFLINVMRGIGLDVNSSSK